MRKIEIFRLNLLFSKEKVLTMKKLSNLLSQPLLFRKNPKNQSENASATFSALKKPFKFLLPNSLVKEIINFNRFSQFIVLFCVKFSVL